MADTPITREEKYLAYLTGDYKAGIPKPITRQERYLYELCLNGMGGEISPEEIQKAVNDYLDKNPVKPGATTEQAQQIEQNKTDIASLKEETGLLKEDLSNKITKFYASSQGETHLADSDNGKIMDMMLYGKSEQKQYSGKNLLNATLQTTTKNGVTCTNNGDGTYTLNGTATERTEFIIDVFNIDISKKYKLIAFTKERNYINCFVQLNQSPWTIYGTSTDSQVTITDSENIRLVISIIKNNTLSNEIIKPMIVDASLYPDATYNDFEPYTGGIPSPNPDYPQEIKSVVNPTVKLSNEDGTQFKTVTLPYTLNAIPVSSGGNVTIDGQQYIADYVDVERGKRIKIIEKVDMGTLAYGKNGTYFFCSSLDKAFGLYNIATTIYSVPKVYTAAASLGDAEMQGRDNNANLFIRNDSCEDVKTLISSVRGIMLYYQLSIPTEIDLTPEEIATFKALATYYPTTNIFINSEQLDGYTVFNYPISMENGWNYVKQQIGDTRDYIYDMDARTQDIDTQSAEAYVNSEYAVALTELEV